MEKLKKYNIFDDIKEQIKYAAKLYFEPIGTVSRLVTSICKNFSEHIDTFLRSPSSQNEELARYEFANKEIDRIKNELNVLLTEDQFRNSLKIWSEHLEQYNKEIFYIHEEIREQESIISDTLEKMLFSFGFTIRSSMYSKVTEYFYLNLAQTALNSIVILSNSIRNIPIKHSIAKKLVEKNIPTIMIVDELDTDFISQNINQLHKLKIFEMKGKDLIELHHKQK